jgi:HSP20 family molecular chaperone IbpA
MSIDPFRLFHSRPGRFFEDPFTVLRPFLPAEESLPFTAWTPPCDIYETEKEIVLKMELPDMKKENVHVTLENNVLTLRGERKFEERWNVRTITVSSETTANSCEVSRSPRSLRATRSLRNSKTDCSR